MSKKYKICKVNGFDPFEDKREQNFSKFLSKKYAKQLQNLSTSKFKQLGIILDNQINQLNHHQQKVNKNYIINQQYEIHLQQKQTTQQNTSQQKKINLIMFSEKQYVKKTFDKVIFSQQLEKQNDKSLLQLKDRKCKNNSIQNSRLIIYIANSHQHSQKIIFGDDIYRNKAILNHNQSQVQEQPNNYNTNNQNIIKNQNNYLQQQLIEVYQNKGQQKQAQINIQDHANIIQDHKDYNQSNNADPNNTKNNNSNKYKGLIHQIYNKILLNKTNPNSLIYMSIIGVEKQNKLYDLLNQKHYNIIDNKKIYQSQDVYQNNYLQEDLTNLKNQRNISSKINYNNNKKKQQNYLKVKKIYNTHNQSSINCTPQPVLLSQNLHSQVYAEDLEKQLIQNEEQLFQVIQKAVNIRNHVEFFLNYNQVNLIAELFHIYEITPCHDVIQNFSLFKINQHFPRLSPQTFGDGFQERRTKQANTSNIGSLVMRLGMNIRASLKINNHSKSTIQKPSLLQMHESKILLYLSQFFKEIQTQYLLINQIGMGQALSDQVRNLTLNIDCLKERNSSSKFVHSKHYLDNKNITNIVGRLAKKFMLTKDNDLFLQNINLRKYSEPHTRNIQAVSLNSNINLNEQLSLTGEKQFKKLSNYATHSNFSSVNPSINHRKNSLFQESEKVRKKSFFSTTISSTQRNYLKSAQRERRLSQKVQKMRDTLQIQNNNWSNLFTQFDNKRQVLKYINSSNKLFGSGRLQGRKIAYKKRLVVKKLLKIEIDQN